MWGWHSGGGMIGKSSIEFVVAWPDHWMPPSITTIAAPPPMLPFPPSSSSSGTYFRLCVLPLPHPMFPDNFAHGILRIIHSIYAAPKVGLPPDTVIIFGAYQWKIQDDMLLATSPLPPSLGCAQHLPWACQCLRMPAHRCHCIR
jgi:hypothetical protein